MHRIFLLKRLNSIKIIRQVSSPYNPFLQKCISIRSQLFQIDCTSYQVVAVLISDTLYICIYSEFISIHAWFLYRDSIKYHSCIIPKIVSYQLDLFSQVFLQYGVRSLSLNQKSKSLFVHVWNLKLPISGYFFHVSG